jgi:hypothetical protein
MPEITNPTTPTTAPVTPTPVKTAPAPVNINAAPTAPTQQPVQQQPNDAITLQEAIFALACFTYFEASAMAFASLSELNPALTVVNNISNSEQLETFTKQVEAAAEKEKEDEERSDPADTMFKAAEETAASGVPIDHEGIS